EVLARHARPGAKREDLFAVGAGLEYLPPGLARFGVDTAFSWLQAGIDGRFFPWRWLFVGARLGYQLSRADSERLGTEISYLTSSFFLAPKVGALYTFPS